MLEKILNIRATRGGYSLANLNKDGKQKSYSVHRLVAEAFLPNPENLPQVNHKDENKANNAVENLEWCTCQYNTQYSIYKLSHKITANGAEYPSIKACSRETGVDNSVIRQHLKSGKPFKGVTYKRV